MIKTIDRFCWLGVGKHTIFGRVSAGENYYFILFFNQLSHVSSFLLYIGMRTIQKMGSVPTNTTTDKPSSDVRLISARILEEGEEDDQDDI